jgi:hypothetical protein
MELLMSRTPKTPTTEPVSPVATFSPEKLAELINEITETRKLVAEQMQEIAELKAAKPQAANGQSAVSLKNAQATIRAFAKAGFGKVTPNVDVFTFNRWVAQGFRPVEGSKSIKVSNLRLFCSEQVRPLTPEEKQAMQAELDAVVSANKRKIVSITEAHPQ